MSLGSIRQQLAPPIGLAIGPGDLLRGFPAALAALDRVDHRRLGQPRPADQARLVAPGFSEVLQDFESEVHASNGNQVDYRVNPKMPAGGHQFGYHSAMAEAMFAHDSWFKRPRFRELCDEWLRNHPGKTKNDLAHELGLADDRSLKQYYSGKKPLSRRLLLQCLATFKVESSELIDDPQATIGGEKVDEMSAQGRMFFSLIYNRFKDSILTDEDREELYKDFCHSFERIKAYKTRIGRT